MLVRGETRWGSFPPAAFPQIPQLPEEPPLASAFASIHLAGDGKDKTSVEEEAEVAEGTGDNRNEDSKTQENPSLADLEVQIDGSARAWRERQRHLEEELPPKQQFRWLVAPSVLNLWRSLASSWASDVGLIVANDEELGPEPNANEEAKEGTQPTTPGGSEHPPTAVLYCHSWILLERCPSLFKCCPMRLRRVSLPPEASNGYSSVVTYLDCRPLSLNAARLFLFQLYFGRFPSDHLGTEIVRHCCGCG